MSELVIIPDKILRGISEPVDSSEDVNDLVQRMRTTMNEHRGIGLAAVQIGVLKRVVLVDPSRTSEDPLVFINPRLVSASLEVSDFEEGCLSIPGVYENVRRPESIVVEYCNQSGEQREERFDGIVARCLQHELDHLEGVLFLDHLSRLKRTRALKKIGSALRV